MVPYLIKLFTFSIYLFWSLGLARSKNELYHSGNPTDEREE